MRSYFFPLLGIALTAIGCNDRKADAPAGTAPALQLPTAAGLPTNSDRAAGFVEGKAFMPDKIVLEGKNLTFQQGKEFFADLKISFELPKSALEIGTWKFGGDQPDSPVVSVSAKGGNGIPNTDFAFPHDYSLSLTITKKTKTALEGNIDLHLTKAAITKLVGAFTAVVKKTANEPLDESDVPYVQGKITLLGPWQHEMLTAGFDGMGTDGKSHSNSAGIKVTAGQATFATSTTFEPQLTTLLNREKEGPGYKHVKMTPGDYVLYIKRDKVLACWKKVQVKAGDKLTVDFTIDPSKLGDLLVTIPDDEAAVKQERPLSLIPEGLKATGKRPHYMFDAAAVKTGQKTVVVKGVPAGKYHAVRGNSEADVEVVAGRETPLTLVRMAEKK